jgi:N-formylglutamate deformylase
LTDKYTPELFSGIATFGGLAVVNNHSRLVVDPERFENDKEEVMSSMGMGAIYTKTASQLMLRKDLSPTEREELLSAYFRPYHEKLEQEVKKVLEQFDRCLIIDCHSFPSKPLPYELDQSMGRPDICIGSDPFHSPKEMITSVISFCKAKEVKVTINKTFAGTFVPQTYLKKDRRVSSTMIEVNRSLYMNERTGDRSGQFFQTKKMIDDLSRKLLILVFDKDDPGRLPSSQIIFKFPIIASPMYPKSIVFCGRVQPIR